jgi:hypothetical protein
LEKSLTNNYNGVTLTGTLSGIFNGNGAGITNVPGYVTSTNGVVTNLTAIGAAAFSNGTNWGAMFTNDVYGNLQLLIYQINNTYQQTNPVPVQINFLCTNGQTASVYFDPVHDVTGFGTTTPELELLSSGSVCIKASQYWGIGTPYYPPNRGIQIGGPNDNRDWLYLATDHGVGSSAGLINGAGTSSSPSYGATNTLGFSTPLLFYANVGVGYVGGGAQTYAPGWQLRMTDTNGNGSLNLYDDWLQGSGYPQMNSSNTDWALAYAQPRVRFRVGNTNVGFDVFGSLLASNTGGYFLTSGGGTTNSGNLVVGGNNTTSGSTISSNGVATMPPTSFILHLTSSAGWTNGNAATPTNYVVYLTCSSSCRVTNIANTNGFVNVWTNYSFVGSNLMVLVHPGGAIAASAANLIIDAQPF